LQAVQTVQVFPQEEVLLSVDEAVKERIKPLEVVEQVEAEALLIIEEVRI